MANNEEDIRRNYHVQPNGHPVATIKVKNDDVEAGYVVINASDFDEKKHKVYDEKAQKPAPAANAAK